MTNAKVLQRRQDDAAPAHSVPPESRPVPDVVGMPFQKAEDILSAAGFRAAEIWLNEPGTSVPFDTVKATSPAAGELQASGDVQIEMPGAAGDAGVGHLNSNDREGFDLDTIRNGRSAQDVDIALQTRDVAMGGGVVVVTRNGTSVAKPRREWYRGNEPDELACETALRQVPTPLEIAVQLTVERTIFGCVRTSTGRIATVRFELSENPEGAADHIFHVRLFPPPLSSTRR